MSMIRFFKALRVAAHNARQSFVDYYRKGFDPLTRDALTLTYNRATFERRRQQLSSYSLLLIDLDNFKQINDHHGHSVGDHVLKAVASALRQSSGDRVFRIGGEEFAVLLRCPEADACKVAQRLCQTVRALKILKDKAVTVSVGVAWSHDLQSAPDHDQIYKRADRALYHAKGHGKNRVSRFFDIRAYGDLAQLAQGTRAA